MQHFIDIWKMYNICTLSTKCIQTLTKHNQKWRKYVESYKKLHSSTKFIQM